MIRRRLKTAIEEIGHHDLYPYKIVNDNLDESYALLRSMYLCRKQGDAVDAAHCARVEANRDADIGGHADALIKDALTPAPGQ